MNAFVVGASGRVGQAVVAKLAAKGVTVVAGSRHVISSDDDHVIPRKLDLKASVAEIAATIGHVDVIFFVAGSRGKDLLQTDAFGAVKVMQAAEQNGIDRFIMLSSLYALEPEKWAQIPSLAAIMDYNIAKFFADNYLQTNTKLAYTIVQPATLTEDAPTNKLSFNHVTSQPNAIADVATALVAASEHANTIGKVIKITGGTTPIDEGMAAL